MLLPFSFCWTILLSSKHTKTEITVRYPHLSGTYIQISTWAVYQQQWHVRNNEIKMGKKQMQSRREIHYILLSLNLYIYSFHLEKWKTSINWSGVEKHRSFTLSEIENFRVCRFHLVSPSSSHCIQLTSNLQYGCICLTIRFDILVGIRWIEFWRSMLKFRRYTSRQ